MTRPTRYPDRYLFTLWLGFILMTSALTLAVSILLLALWRQDLVVMVPTACYLLWFLHRAPTWIHRWIDLVNRHFRVPS